MRKRASAGGSRDRSSKRKYSDTKRSSPLKLAAPRRAWRPGPQGQRREVQPRRPAFGLLRQLGRLTGVELDSRSFQQALGFSLVQPKVRHADLVHPPMGAPAGKRQVRGFPARDRDLRAVRHVLEQRGERRPGRPGWQRRADRRALAPAGARAQPVRSRQAGRGWPRWIPQGPTTRRTPRAGAGSTRWIAAAMYRRNTTASPSPPSSATHANGRGSASLQFARSVVLPYPTGATTRHERHGRRAEPIDQVRLRHGALPRKRRSELHVHDVEGDFGEGHRKTLRDSKKTRNHPVGMRKGRRRTLTLSVQSHLF